MLVCIKLICILRKVIFYSYRVKAKIICFDFLGVKFLFIIEKNFNSTSNNIS